MAAAHQNQSQPRSLLYSIAAGIGGSGLDQVAHQSLLLAVREGFLGRAIAFSTRQNDVPREKLRLLSRHPVKLLSFLGREHYMGAKRHALDHAAASELRSGKYDLLHTWSGDCVSSARVANRLGIPVVLEIPTWHRNKGKIKPEVTQSERVRDAAGFPRSLLNRCLITRQQVMEEYERADLILVLSQKAKETFLIAGIPEARLFLTTRGVDVDRFAPSSARPAIFRAIFAGALIRRKGVHILLEAWKRLNLKDAELVLIGNPGGEIRRDLDQAGPNVVTRGFVKDVASEMRQACVHIFPSECEGSAKVTYEASACGLAQITTRESGDVVVNGETGLIIPPNDVEALCSAIRQLHGNPDMVERMGCAARRRAVENFTWDHFRSRLAAAYQRAMTTKAA